MFDFEFKLGRKRGGERHCATPVGISASVAHKHYGDALLLIFGLHVKRMLNVFLHAESANKRHAVNSWEQPRQPSDCDNSDLRITQILKRAQTLRKVLRGSVWSAASGLGLVIQPHP